MDFELFSDHPVTRRDPYLTESRSLASAPGNKGVRSVTDLGRSLEQLLFNVVSSPDKALRISVCYAAWAHKIESRLACFRVGR